MQYIMTAIRGFSVAINASLATNMFRLNQIIHGQNESIRRRVACINMAL